MRHPFPILAALSVLAAAPVALADSCYQRLYSSAHLTGQPDQTVSALTVRFIPLESETVAYVEARFRGSDRIWKNTLGCYPTEGAEQATGATLRCSVDCDGGSFLFRAKDDGSVLITTHGFAVGVGCGDEGDQTRSVSDRNRGDRPTTYRLDPLDLANCPKWNE